MLAVLELKPEVATVIVGSMNYGRFKKAHDQGVDDFKLASCSNLTPTKSAGSARCRRP